MKTLFVTRSNILRNSVVERSVLHGHSMAARMGKPGCSRSAAVLGVSRRVRHGYPRGDLHARNKSNHTLVDVVGVSRVFHGVFSMAVSSS